uniref:MalT-like TPR region domain-containing protein n=1 Tax=Chaetoceros debilis TaxID=122233 RepID=A0A7S3V7M0_9STRA|mmetsp:Transcript_14180/g.21202  ORF Transcript_14180/g.21202 Transcript_14180/m.21202 type:complete len:562 (+) Transcript_14180:58-1743(+)
MMGNLYSAPSADICNTGRSLFQWGKKGSIFEVASDANQLDVDGQLNLGVSVYHLSTTFADKVSEVHGNSNPVKIYEILDTIICPTGEQVECSRDGRIGAAYVDAIGDEDTGPATHMLSYTWGYTVQSIVSSLSKYCQDNDLDPKKTYFWMCCLCVNQHRVNEAREANITVPFQTFKSTFEGRVRKIGHVVALMAPWDGPRYLNRVWCVFEMSQALQVPGIELDIIMPPEEKEAFGKALEDGTGELEDVYNVLWSVSIENAEATVEEDRKNILTLIENGPGFHVINTGVSKRIMTWFLSSAEDYAYEILNQGGMSPHCPRVVAKIGDLLMEANERKRALDLFNEGVRVARSNETISTNDGGYILLIRGVLHRWEGNLSLALENFEECRKILKEVKCWKTADGSTCLRQMALVKEMNGDLKGSIKIMQESKAFREETNTLNQQQGANLLKQMGHIYKKLGKEDKGEKYIMNAFRIFQDNDLMGTSDGANIHFAVGTCKLEKGDEDGAVEHYQRAVEIREKIQTIRSPQGASQLDSLAKLLRKMGKNADALLIEDRATNVRETL